jgi:hypothetical protein
LAVVLISTAAVTSPATPLSEMTDQRLTDGNMYEFLSKYQYKTCLAY